MPAVLRATFAARRNARIRRVDFGAKLFAESLSLSDVPPFFQSYDEMQQTPPYQSAYVSFVGRVSGA